MQLSSSIGVLFPTGIVPLVEGLTITRIRGDFLVFIQTANAAADGFSGAVGIMLVPDEAFAAGVGSIPIPLDDIDYEEWIWYQSFNIKAPIGAIATDEPSYAGPSFLRAVIDSKAMRKFPVGKTLCAVLEGAESGTTLMRASIQGRMLVTLP